MKKLKEFLLFKSYIAMGRLKKKQKGHKAFLLGQIIKFFKQRKNNI